MTTIKLKNGSGAPLAGDLVQGEPALDLTNKRLYTEDSSGAVIEVGTNPTSVTTGNIAATGTATFAGLTTTADVSFGDNDKAIFGAGNDLSIYHDGSHSYIEDAAGTGNLKLRTNTLQIENAAGTELSALFLQDGAVTLYNDNTARLATTSTGIDVTGDVGTNLQTNRTAIFRHPNTNQGILEIRNGRGDASVVNRHSSIQAWSNEFTNPVDLLLNPEGGNVGIGTSPSIYGTTQSYLSFKGRTGDYAILELDGAGTAQGGEVDFGGGGVRQAGIASLTGSHLAFYTNSTNSGQTVTERMRTTSGGDVIFYNSAGTSQDFYWDASTSRLGIADTSPSSKFSIYTGSQANTLPIKLTSTRNFQLGDVASVGIFGSGFTDGSHDLGAIRFSTADDKGDDGSASWTRIYAGGQSSTYASTNLMATFANQGSGSDYITFATEGTERLTIDGSGNVGIGVTPLVNLQVKTTTATNETAFRVSDDVTQTLNVIVDGTASTGGIHYQNPNLGYQRWSTSGIERMRIDGGGDISFYNSAGSSQDFYWDASTSRLGLGGLVLPRGSLSVASQNRLWNVNDDGVNNYATTSATNTSGGVVLHRQVADRFHFGRAVDGTDDKVVIASDGTVAIGDTTTDNAANQLKVKASGADGRIAMSTASTTGSAAIEAQVANYWSGSTFVGTGIVQHDSASSGTTAGISNANLGMLRFQNTSAAFIYTNGASPIYFGTATTKRMTLDANGNFLVGTTSNANSARINVQGASGARPIDVRSGLSTGSAITMIAFYDNASDFCGQITIDADVNTTQYASPSDYRLKENVVPLTGAMDRVKQLKPTRFNFIASPNKIVDGFIAHEVQEVIPEAATGSKDAMRDEEYEVTPAVYEDVVIPAVLDEEGNEVEAERTEQQLVTEAVMGTRSVPDYQGIDQSKIVPLLVAAIQELEARLAAIESN